MEIKVTINKILYEETERGFTVLSAYDENDDYCKITANTVGLCSGIEVTFEGEWVNDSRYGKTFKAIRWKENIPTKAKSIETYLCSGIFKGIGSVLAKSIVDRFKDDTLNIIDSHSADLLKVPKIGLKKAQQIWATWDEHKDLRVAMTYLLDYDISVTYAVKIVKKYKNRTISVIQNNPYQLIYDIEGIGFAKADEIAIKLGIDKKNDDRIKAGFIYVLTMGGEDGNTYMEKADLLGKTSGLLEVEEEFLTDRLDYLCSFDKSDITQHGNEIYLSQYYYAEKNIAKRIVELLHYKGGDELVNNVDVDKIETELGIKYESEQADAIRTSLNSNIMVLTGGPGTGKTTVTRGIIRAFQDHGFDIGCVAPTGKAAERMSEATGMEAKTIHRFLGYKPDFGYEFDEYNPLDYDVIIVDECSMVNVLLMNSLIKAISNDTKLILIGDVDQLPSIGAGNVLNDIIASDTVPVVKLDKIFRQAQSSRIITNAHMINKGYMPSLSNKDSKDFFYMEMTDGDVAADTVVDLITKRLPKAYNVQPRDIQLLTPMKKGNVGVMDMNHRLQSVINPIGASITYGQTIFRVGDKVMQIKNNYDKDVFNGDTGTIVGIDCENKEITVKYKSVVASYGQNEFDELVLAYAMTIHKSQGSEYDIIVLPILREHAVMLQRNLLYTAITRAKKICVLVGDRNMIGYCVHNFIVGKRLTSLKKRLKKYDILATSIC